jgi:hypothetical protein
MGEMGWLRPRVRLGAWLALIALAMNLGLAFGHHHFDELATEGVAATADHPASAEHPHGDGDHHGSPAVHPCFACVIVTAAVLTANPPALPSPTWTKEVGLTTAFFGLRDSKRTSFEARAPPRS